MFPKFLPSLAVYPGLALSLATAAFSQTRYPVISRVDLLFSVVSHHSHLQQRIDFYNAHGVPRGNVNYAVPHLVYEPIVTLYNPYNETLTMNRSRIRISDPPVGFAFKKNDAHLRTEFGNGEFHGLAPYQIQNESNPAARKSFTLLLTSPNSVGRPGAKIVLGPGESRTFATWVESDWTWMMETSGGYTPRSFFDWNADLDLTHRDGRTGNPFGIEAVSSEFLYQVPRPQAGFQTDGLSVSNGRPNSTRYDFEIAKAWSGNWVAIEQRDTFNLRAKTMRVHPASNDPDFQIELLKGSVQDPARDLVKRFPLDLATLDRTGTDAVVSRTFRISDILQTATDRTPGGKTPFAMLTLLAKAKAVRDNRFFEIPAAPVNSLYEMRFHEVSDFFIHPISPSDASTGGLEVLGVTRSGDTLFVDFMAEADRYGGRTWRMRGTSSLEDGFNDDLDSVTTLMTGQSVSGVYKAIIDVSGRGDRYFVRIEE